MSAAGFAQFVADGYEANARRTAGNDSHMDMGLFVGSDKRLMQIDLSSE